MRAAADNGIKSLFDENRVYLFTGPGFKLIASGQRRGKLYYLKGNFINNFNFPKINALRSCNTAPEALWHVRLGHINRERLKSLWRQDMATGMKVTCRKKFYL